MRYGYAEKKIELYCDRLMNVTKYDRLFIRSSLLNNNWKGDGSKTDVICTIPITGDPFDIVTVYIPPGQDNRLYEVKESALAAGSFGIRITDQYDELVEFSEDYLLEIAFFFNPSNNPVSRF